MADKSKGWIKLFRDLNSTVHKDTDYLAIFVYLLLNASRQDYEMEFGNNTITVKRGQLITARDSIVNFFGGKNKVSSSKVQRVLKRFENEQVIEQHTTPFGRLITVVNYDTYQSSEQPNEQRVNNEWTTTEQPLNINKNIRIKELKNFKDSSVLSEKDEKGEIIPYKEIVEYLNGKTKMSLKHTTNKTRDLIKARWNEGFRIDDFKKCIDNAVKFRTHTNGTIDTQYLQPKTLFNGSFESRVMGATYQSVPKELKKEDEIESLKGRYDHLITRG